MTIIQFIRAKLIVARVAKQQGISPSRCRADMVAAIEEAWSTSDPEVKLTQTRLVGDSHIPSPEELITILSSL